MRKIIFLSFLLISVSGQIFAQEEFVINGTLPNEKYDGKLLYLKQIDNIAGSIPIDSCLVTKNTFVLKGTVSDSPYPALVFFKERPEGLPLASIVVIEAGNINLDITKKSNIGGTPYNDELQQFHDEQNQIIGKIQQETDADNLKKWNEELKTSTYNYLDKNMTNGIGEFFIEDASRMLDLYQVIELIRKSRPDFQETPQIKFLVTELLTQQPSVGDPYLDLELTDINGDPHSLSEYVNESKYILIDFWASWCGPCLEEIPNLVKAYKKYKDKGFEIVSISLDQDKRQLEQTIKNKNMDWIQLTDLMGYRSSAARLYKAKAIPLTFLVDNEGKVIEKNLRGDGLSKKLKELLD